MTGKAMPRRGLWRNTPPALFPPVLGLLGLGHGWRRAVEVFSFPAGPVELFLGAVSLLFLFLLVAYGAKVIRRPKVVAEDMRILPGRAGLATIGMAMMLLAVVALPYSRPLAAAILALAVLVHGAVIVVALKVLWRAPLPQRRMTPVWHLIFVGLIVAPIAGIPLGWGAFSEWVLILTTAAAITIWAGSAVELARAPVPAPLRPTLAIHLSPACLIGMNLYLAGAVQASLWVGYAAIAGAGVLLARARWLTAAGFSPLWGAFTFPLAAFAVHMLMLAASYGGAFRLIGGAALIGGTLLIPPIAWRVLKMWGSGMLAVRTNAASV